jgi:ketosteroid isomerase-like protein
MTNTQIVESVYAAFRRRDMPAVLAFLAEDVTWGMVGREQDLPMAGIRNGKSGAAGFFRTMAETIEVTTFEPLSFVEAGDTVFAFGRWSWTMRHNGCPGENEWLHVFTLRDGKVTQYRGYNDTAQLALAYRAPAKRAANA